MTLTPFSQVSVGIESIKDIIVDFEEAFKVIPDLAQQGAH